MLPDLPQYATYRAALVEWHQSNVGDDRAIFIAREPVALLDDVNKAIVNWTDVLYDEHSEYINLYDLEELHSQFAEGLYPEEGWTHWDIRELLQALLHERREDLHNNVAERSILGSWHDLVQWINDVLPYGDWTGVAIEGALPDFARQLLLSEAARYQPVGPKSVTDATARWLGKLAIVALSDEWQWSRKDIYRFFLTLVDEFNERYSFG